MKRQYKYKWGAPVGAGKSFSKSPNYSKGKLWAVMKGHTHDSGRKKVLKVTKKEHRGLWTWSPLWNISIQLSFWRTKRRVRKINLDSNVVPHRSTNKSRSCLTSLSRREAVLSWLYGPSCQNMQVHTIYYFLVVTNSNCEETTRLLHFTINHSYFLFNCGYWRHAAFAFASDEAGYYSSFRSLLLQSMFLAWMFFFSCRFWVNQFYYHLLLCHLLGVVRPSGLTFGFY